MSPRPSAVIASLLLSIAELSTQDETSTLVCNTHTHTHTVSKLQKPKANFHLSSCCHGNHLQRTILLLTSNLQRFVGLLSATKMNNAVEYVTLLICVWKYFFSLLSSLCFIPPFFTDHSFVPLCSFSLYICSLTNQEVHVFITLYTEPVSILPLHNR